MNWWRFLIYALVFWIIAAIILVFLFLRWPAVAQSPWAIGGLFLIALLASRVIQKLSKK